LEYAAPRCTSVSTSVFVDTRCRKITPSSVPIHPLLAIGGPTGSGKSELALKLAAVFSGEIVNCDSLQIYRRFDIGTAKLSPEERQGIPHHLIDILNPDEPFTAGEYSRCARPLFAEIAGRGKVPVIVGGTGFYLRALLEGLFTGPSRDDALRTQLVRRNQRRPRFLHRLLRRLDPLAAARIHPNDTSKLVRAVEVCLLEGQPLSRLFAERKTEPLPGFATLKIALAPERTALYERLDRRCEAMFRAGLVEEIRQILAAGYSEDVKPFGSLGYAQALRVVRGEMTEGQAVKEAQQETRRYSKRQLTWLRRERDVHWLAGFGDTPAIQSEAIALVRRWLGGKYDD